MRKIVAILLSLVSAIPFSASTRPPTLIVQIVIDQLRGDLINKYQKQFSAKGFNFMLKHSLNYANTHHPHADTVTCVGHATIATGAYPALHGIVENDWYESKLGRNVYCVEDKQSTILPVARTKIQPEGRSPKRLVASTFSDELVLAHAGRAFAVSLKDRSAIMLAGHAGKAFWFDKINGGVITSKYYYKNYPQWVVDWNKRYTDRDDVWVLSKSANAYIHAQAPRFNHRYQHFGQNFPHYLGKPASAEYYKHLSMTPFADELTADFAINLLKNEQLGKTIGKTDYLAVSFSAVDSIGHQFGPNSLESEDNLLHLDKTIGNFINEIDKQVGLRNTLIVLTADHGVSDSSIYLQAHAIKNNIALNIKALQETIEHSLDKRYQLPSNTLLGITLPYIYLNHQLIHDHQLSVQEVSAYLAEILTEHKGVFRAYSLPLSANTNWLESKVAKMAFPKRSGDLYIVNLPYQSLTDTTEQYVAHGTPWRYDSYVPLLFVNPVFANKQIIRPTQTTDIAPTLAALIGIKFPSAATGKPLPEVIAQLQKSSKK